MDAITHLAEQWLSLDRDPVTRKEIEDLLQDDNQAELEKLLRTRISFGTAGLRARMQAGFARMNALTVIQASQGLAEYLIETVPRAQEKGVVIGCDARFNSAKFSALTASAFISKGFKVWRFRDAIHTPLVPYSVVHLKAAAGVMVTASHNPAQDNGYKVYWENGCQIIPPHDVGIATAIEHNLIPICWDPDLPNAESHLFGDQSILDETVDKYFNAVVQLAAPTHVTHLPRFVYTPMHGVGFKPMRTVINLINQTGSDSPILTVQEQVNPDPTFPTVKFPNPEEAGALKLAITTAEKESISIIIANDPDADRLAVVEKDNSTNQWHQFTGNQIGILLAAYVLSRFISHKPQELSKMAMLCSTVSTGMLRKMAEVEGFHFVETLTGFKWLGNVAQQLQSTKGYTVPYAFEEALGYMLSDVAYDKDGISAAAIFLTAATTWKETEGLTPLGKLEQLYKKYGYFADANTYLISPSQQVTDKVFAAIRNSASSVGAKFPSHIGDLSIVRYRDLTIGFDSGTSDNIPDLPVDPTSQMITCELERGVRFTVRASGTEPKIKFYVEATGKTADKASSLAQQVKNIIIKEWFGDSTYALVKP